MLTFVLRHNKKMYERQRDRAKTDEAEIPELADDDEEFTNSISSIIFKIIP